MKKGLIVVYCMLSIFTLTLAGYVAAYDANFTHTDYMSSIMPTIDGTYVANDEWVASLAENFGTNGIFRDEWSMTAGTFENLLIETSDATNDAGDYWQICYDSSADGGAAPSATDDFRVDITGHGASPNVTWYRGTGTGWTQVAGPAAGIFDCAQSLSSSPRISAQHYVLEMHVDKQDTTTFGIVIVGMNFVMRVAYFDAHAGGNGLQVWPPSSARDVPDGWGYVPYATAANPTPDVPESLGIGVVLAVSSVAVIAGAVLLRKKPQIIQQSAIIP